MAETSWPFDDQDTTEGQYSTLLSLAVDTGVSSGLAPYGDSSGMFVKVPTGLAVVRGFAYRNDAVLTLTVAPAAAQARVDAVVLRLDLTANRVYAAVKTGDASGTAPALLQVEGGAWEVLLGGVAVPAAATTVTAASVTDQRTYASKPVGFWKTATRPPAPVDGKIGFNSDLQQVEAYYQGTWRPAGAPVTTDASKLTSGTLPNGRLDYGVVAAVRGDRTVDAPLTDGEVNGDWNTVGQPGVYRTNGNRTNTNAPAGAYGFGTLVVLGAGATISSRTQAYYAHGTGKVYSRTAWNGNDWTGWRRLLDTDDQVPGSSGGGGGTGQIDTAPVTYASNTQPNNGVDLSRVNTIVTFRFNLTLTSGRPAGTGSDANILQLPSGFRPRSFPADFTCHNGSSIWGAAIDPDGWLRLRTAGISGGGLWGSVTYQT